MKSRFIGTVLIFRGLQFHASGLPKLKYTTAPIEANRTYTARCPEIVGALRFGTLAYHPILLDFLAITLRTSVHSIFDIIATCTSTFPPG
jgi:hypothetical protein